MDLLQSLKRSTKIIHEGSAKIPAKGLTVVVFCSGALSKSIQKKLEVDYGVQIDPIKNKSGTQELRGQAGTIWLLCPQLIDLKGENKKVSDDLPQSKWGAARDLCGSLLKNQKLRGDILVDFYNCSDDELIGGVLGIGLANYNYLDICKDRRPDKKFFFRAHGKPIAKSLVDYADALYSAMNLTRHLTNLPSGQLNPETFCEAVEKFFAGRKGLKVKTLEPTDLKKLNMNLLLGVGQGSRTGSRLMRLEYKSNVKNKKRFAFVGKGVTFDTGGLDLKNSSGMRLMKKDMAGAATLAGLCHFVSTMGLNQPCDFYLPLAENAVSRDATRPGDVHEARSGLWVEIDNTDAEGRLVMADALDLALNPPQGVAPSLVMDVSTLTGAARVALGLDVAAYFSNSDAISKKIEKSSRQVGDPIWRLPRVSAYQKQLRSAFADCKNSSDTGFGGAITAALFLEKFVGETPWVHFDAMCWTNSSHQYMAEGGNGQCLQVLAQFLSSEK